MKKRRELDALVGGPKPSGSGRGMKNGRHELLRNDSDSSEVEEFAMPQKSSVRKRERCQCCSLCMTMCSGFLLVLCMISVGGLIWMNIELKNEVYLLQGRVDSAEQATKIVKENMQMIHELSEEKNKLKSEVDGLKSSELVLTKQLTQMNSTVQLLLTQSQASSSLTGINELQDHLNQLTKNVAVIGSNVQSVQEEQSKLTNRVTDLESAVKDLQAANSPKTTDVPDPLNSKSTTIPVDVSVNQHLASLWDELISLNGSLNHRLQLMSSDILFQCQQAAPGHNETQLLQGRIVALEKKIAAVNVSAGIQDAVSKEVEKFRNSNVGNTNASIAAVENVKNYIEARMSTLQVEELEQNRTVVALASEVNAVKQALDEVSTNSSSSLMVLAHRVDTIGDRLDTVEKAIKVLNPTTKVMLDNTEGPLTSDSKIQRTTSQPTHH